MQTIQFMQTLYLLGALIGTMFLQHGFVKYGGRKYAHPMITIIFFCIQMFIWPIYLIIQPAMVKNMYNCTVFEAIDMHNGFVVSKVEEDMHNNQ